MEWIRSLSKTQIKLLMVPALLGIGFVVPFFVSFVFQASHHLAHRQDGEKYLIGIVWAILFQVLLIFLPFSRDEKRHLAYLWILRTFVTLVAMLFYEMKYSLDAYHYYMDGISGVYEADLVFGNGTLFITQLVGLFSSSFPTGESFHAFKVIWSFIGFIGSFQFYRAFKIYTGKENIPLLWALLCFPSMIFWSSILGKDPVTIFGLGIACVGIAKFYKQNFRSGFAYLIVGCVTVAFVRMWYVYFVMFPLLVSLITDSKMPSTRRNLLLAALFSGTLFGGGFIMEKLDFFNADMFERLNTVSSAWSEGGSGQQVPRFDGPADIAKFLPIGMFTAVFRPLPGEVKNIFGLLAGFENLIMLYLCVRLVFISGMSVLKDRLVVYSTVFVFLWSIMYAFISFQNLGTAVRFKVQILPFIFLILFLSQGKSLVKSKGMEK